MNTLVVLNFCQVISITSDWFQRALDSRLQEAEVHFRNEHDNLLEAVKVNREQGMRAPPS